MSDSDDENHEDIVICNFGGSNTAGAFAGEDAPRFYFPTILARPKQPILMVGPPSNQAYVGDDVPSRMYNLRLIQPIQGGYQFGSADDIEALMHHTLYNELRVDPKVTPLAIVVHPLTSGRDREMLCQIAMGTLSVPRFSILEAPSMSLMANALTTGVVIHIGGSSMYCSAVYEGTVLHYTVTTSNVNGVVIRDRLAKFVSEQSSSWGFSTTAELAICDNMKQTMCYVRSAQEMDGNKLNGTDSQFEYPDGSTIDLRPEARWGPPEVIFNPTLAGLEPEDSIVHIVEKTLEQCPPEIRHEIAPFVVLDGASARFRGLVDRLEYELKRSQKMKSFCRKPSLVTEAKSQPMTDSRKEQLRDPNDSAAICSREEEDSTRTLRVWHHPHSISIGASVFVDLLKGRNELGDCFMTKSDYEAYGPAAGRWLRL